MCRRRSFQQPASLAAAAARYGSRASRTAMDDHARSPDGTPSSSSPGGWTRREGPEREEIPNRSLTRCPAPAPTTQRGLVATWARSPATSSRSPTRPSSAAGSAGSTSARATSIARAPTRCSTMHDGPEPGSTRARASPASGSVDEACEALISTVRSSRSCRRHQQQRRPAVEYTPWPERRTPLPGGGGDAYLVAIRDGLKPGSTRRFRTKPITTTPHDAGSSLAA